MKRLVSCLASLSRPCTINTFRLFLVTGVGVFLTCSEFEVVEYE
jgi:hypothetical protein